MLLGFGAFAELPISSAGPENSVTISVTGNQVTISIGDTNITADSIVEIPAPSQVVLGLGTVTFTGDANVEPTGSTLTLASGTAQAITWSEIIPGATMVWTPIAPGT